MKTNSNLIGLIVLLIVMSACKQTSENQALALSEKPELNEDIATVEPLNDRTYNMESQGFIYSVKPRFNAITKRELEKVTAFSDFIGQAHVDRIVEYKRLSVFILEGNEETEVRQTGSSGEFNAEQLALLKSFDYSTNISIRAYYDEKFDYSEELFDGSWTPYLTVVPETQTAYSNGNESILNELRNKSEAIWSSVNIDKLKPGMLYFTITKDGTIQNLRLDSSCGYGHVDNRIKELITNSEGSWTPAQDIDGNAVDQELVISYGAMGC